jgi:iron complex transport system substrate-binding protein
MAVFVVALLACGVLSIASESIVELTDQVGNTVCIPQPVERLASLYGPGTFYIYALGASDRLVAATYIGVKGVSKAPASLFRLESRLEELLCYPPFNIEEMVARNPDLVMVDATRHSQLAAQFQELGIPVIQYITETPEALRSAVRTTARALGPEAEELAEEFCTDFDRVYSTVKEALADEEKVSVLFIGTEALRVVSGDMYQNDLFAAAGGTLVSHELRGYWNNVNCEQIFLWNPDVIIIAPYGPVQPVDLLEDPDWQAISAIQNGRVHRMPRLIAPWDTPVPESLLAVVWIAEVLHPGEIGLDLSSEIKHFYNNYYHYTLTDEELAKLTSQ